MPVRLIASDMDGTLLGSNRVIPKANVDAIRATQDRGIIFAVATGRFPENAHVLMEEYDLFCPIIGINGGKIVDERLRVISERFMLPGTAEQVQEILEKAGAEYFLFGRRGVCTSGENVFHHSELAYGRRIEELGLTYYHGAVAAREFARGNIYKFFVRNNVPLVPLRESLKAVKGIQLTQSSPYNIEVMPLGVDKGRGIRDFALSMGIPLEETMTLGDEENDVPMLAAVGYGVAMGNASRLAKAAARFITDTNEECGFAKAIWKYALREE